MSSVDNLVHPPLLEPLDLLLESLNLAPTIQRPAIILAQAAHHLAARALHLVRPPTELLAALELGT